MLTKVINMSALVLCLGVGCSESNSGGAAPVDAAAIDAAAVDQGTTMVDAAIDRTDGTLATDATAPSDVGGNPDAGEALDQGAEADQAVDSGPTDPSPVTCESACAELVECLIAECSGFGQGAAPQLSRRCLDRCTPQQAETFSRQTCAENIAVLREEQQLIANACQNDDNPGPGPDPEPGPGDGVGINMLYIGHSFGRNFAERLPQIAANVGIGNHRSNIVFSGGASGAPLALWENAAKRRDAQEILDGGDIEVMVMICCSEPWLETGEDPGIVNWMNYALEQNPTTSFGLAMPWIDFPENYDTAAEYTDLWTFGYAQWRGTVAALRIQFPDVEIFTIPHGQAAGDLMTLFEMGALPDVEQLRGPENTSIFTDPKGHAGKILKDMGGLIWLGSIYGVDVSEYAFERNYVTDLAGMAETIVSEDDYTRQP